MIVVQFAAQFCLSRSVEGEGAFDELMASIAADDMIVRQVEMDTADVVYLKGILEAYPGVATVHARPGRHPGARSHLMIATTPGFAEELDGVLAGVSSELSLAVEAR